jgi:hypothetical protein
LNPSPEPAVLDALTAQAQSLLPAVSFVGSAASVGVTGYFWFVRVNRERPRLLIEGLDHSSYVDLGACEEGVRTLCFRQGLVVVNESTLPSAVLSVGVRIRPRQGSGWQAVAGVRPVPGSSIPLNLPPMQSGQLTIEWEIMFPYLDRAEDLEAPDRVVDAYLAKYWAEPGRVAVDIRGVRGRTFTAHIPLRGSHMVATVRNYLELQRAA